MDSVDKPHSGVDRSQERHGQLMDKAWITPQGSYPYLAHNLPTPFLRPAHTSIRRGLTHPAHIPGGYGGFPILFIHYNVKPVGRYMMDSDQEYQYMNYYQLSNPVGLFVIPNNLLKSFDSRTVTQVSYAIMRLSLRRLIVP
jgi:hypothetical protein